MNEQLVIRRSWYLGAVACLLYFAMGHTAMAADPCSVQPPMGGRDPCVVQHQSDLERIEKTLRDTASTGYVDQGLAKKASVNDQKTSVKALTAEAVLESASVALDMASLEKRLEKRIDDTGNRGSFRADRFWVLLAALLVFFMQAGFKALEVGLVPKETDTWQAAKKLFSWIVTCVGYYYIGFGLMFGFADALPPTDPQPLGQWLGQLPWALPEGVLKKATDAIGKGDEFRGLEFFLFQAAFAATAVTIPAGGTAQRMSVNAYILVALAIATIIYPVFGHWAWGGSIYSGADSSASGGFLQARGFHDFAGSTVVHSIGGWCALLFAIYLGPRQGRFHGEGFKNNVKSFTSRSRGYAILGVFMLWFGWWGFNGGSKLVYDSKIADIILKTNLAGAGAGLSAYALAWLAEHHLDWKIFRNFFVRGRGAIPEKVIGGALGGLVAITASCDLATPSYAFFVVGLSAGIVHNLAYDFLLWWGKDDPVGAVPVHLACGIWGTWLVAGTSSSVEFRVQLGGTILAGLWAAAAVGGIFLLPDWVRVNVFGGSNGNWFKSATGRPWV